VFRPRRQIQLEPPSRRVSGQRFIHIIKGQDTRFSVRLDIDDDLREHQHEAREGQPETGVHRDMPERENGHFGASTFGTSHAISASPSRRVRDPACSAFA
jgi:hypothetical protein